jgi:hypothetical protein
MNLSLPEADVLAVCQKLGVSVSASEPLPSGGTHLVCTIMDGADEVRRKLQSNLIAGKVKRFPFFTVAASR